MIKINIFFTGKKSNPNHHKNDWNIFICNRFVYHFPFKYKCNLKITNIRTSKSYFLNIFNAMHFLKIKVQGNNNKNIVIANSYS